MGMVYAVLKENKVDTSNMTPKECVEKFNELSSKENLKKEEQAKSKNVHEERVSATINENIIAENLDKNIDAILNNTYPKTHLEIFKEMPDIYKSIGIPNKPLLITAKHAYLAINDKGKYKGENNHYHGLGKKLFLMIPKLLQSPMMVYKSNKDNRDIVCVLNWHDKYKNILIVPIRIKGETGDSYYIEPNIIKSVYGKNDLENYINKNVSNENILLVENQKIRNWQ